MNSVRGWRFSLIFILLSVVSLGKDWPVAQDTLNEILNRSSRWSKLSEEKKLETRSQLVNALHLAGSLEARKVFFGHIDQVWDSRESLNKKREVLNEAETMALQSAKKVVEKWTEAKGSSGKLMSADAIIFRLTGGNLATEKFHEWDRFLNEKGEINYKSWPLGGNPSLAENERPEVDLIKFISENYPEGPSERKEKARKLQELASPYGYGYSNFSEISSSRAQGTYSSGDHRGACGTPSSDAPTLRPELNGRP